MFLVAKGWGHLVLVDRCSVQAWRREGLSVPENDLRWIIHLYSHDCLSSSPLPVVSEIWSSSDSVPLLPGLYPLSKVRGTISAKHWGGVSNWRPVLVWLRKGAALLKWRVFCWIHRLSFIFFSLFHHRLRSLFHHSHWSLLHCYSISFSLLVWFSEKQSFFCSNFKF